MCDEHARFVPCSMSQQQLHCHHWDVMDNEMRFLCGPRCCDKLYEAQLLFDDKCTHVQSILAKNKLTHRIIYIFLLYISKPPTPK